MKRSYTGKRLLSLVLAMMMAFSLFMAAGTYVTLQASADTALTGSGC